MSFIPLIAKLHSAMVVLLPVNYCNALLAALMDNIVLWSCCRGGEEPLGCCVLTMFSDFSGHRTQTFVSTCVLALLVSYRFHMGNGDIDVTGVSAKGPVSWSVCVWDTSGSISGKHPCSFPKAILTSWKEPSFTGSEHVCPPVCYMADSWLSFTHRAIILPIAVCLTPLCPSDTSHSV